MDPEELVRYLQAQMQRAMPDLLTHMLARTETRVTMERDVVRRDYILHIDLLFEGRRLASYQNRLSEEMLRDGLRPRPRLPDTDAEELYRMATMRAGPPDDLRNFFGVLPEDTPRTRPHLFLGRAEERPAPPTPTRPATPPTPEPPRAPALRDQTRRLDFGADEDE